MTKKDAVKALGFTASLLELIGENEFRAKAYQTAERALDNLSGNWETLVEKGFTGVRGIGKELASHLSQFHATGKFPPLEELKTRVPNGVLSLFKVRGLGAKKIRTLWDSGIVNLDHLISSARAGELAALKGFGLGSQKTILENAEFVMLSSERRLLQDAEQVFLKLVALFPELQLEPAGSLSRHLETIGDLDVVACGEPNLILSVLEQLKAVPDKTYPHLYAFSFEGFEVQLAIASKNTLGATQLVMRGSKPFLQDVFAKAQAKGFELSSLGLQKDSELITTISEAEVFRLLELPYRPPFFREAEHQSKEFPTGILQKSDVIGMLHVHTNASDGSHSLREMAIAAQSLGMRYLGICDHSRSAFYANGLSIARVQSQWQEIEALNTEFEDFQILKGIESDILTDGSLDYPDEILAGFDFIVSSIHSQFTLSNAAQTERLIKAVQNPFTTILGHPTGRLLLRRPSYEFDMEAVLEAALAAGTVIEINANPNRLDLDWRIVLGQPTNLFAVNTDAHSTAGYLDLIYGVQAAQKGGLNHERCINSWSVQRFLEFAAAKRLRS
jgi:DNA polymerase (family X)